MIVNFAERAHNHNFELDPIVRSLLDTDWYKLSMLQFIWKHFPRVHASFSLINRTRSVRLAEQVDEAELRRQLDHARALRFRRSELIWLQGNTFYGQYGIFAPEFIQWLAEFRLPPYALHRANGQWELHFGGTWLEATMWEIHALSIVSELRTRWALAKLSEFELDILYARAKARLWDKVERLRGVPGLRIADFGTRRRHSFLWQEYVVQAMRAELGAGFTGTSNAFLAHKHDLEAIGTNAHELPMVLAALARQGRLDGTSLKDSQYRVLELWRQTYGGAMLVMLPDTYGTTQFLRDAPDWVADYKGARLDSKDPFVGGEEILAFYEGRGRDPRDKLIIPSDALDVAEILGLHAQFGGTVGPGVDARRDFRSAADFRDPAKWREAPRIRDSEGWGTLLTNDFRDCHPRGLADLAPISLVCKVTEVEGGPAVKLSDNYAKATGPAEEVAYYRSVFGTEGIANVPVVA